MASVTPMSPAPSTVIGTRREAPDPSPPQPIGTPDLAGAADAAVQAAARGSAAGRERALATYQTRMKDELGGYYTLGRVFVRLIENPQIMRICTRYGLPRPLLMRFTLKLLADCYEPRGGDMVDRVISGLTRLAPAA